MQLLPGAPQQDREGHCLTWSMRTLRSDEGGLPEAGIPPARPVLSLGWETEGPARCSLSTGCACRPAEAGLRWPNIPNLTPACWGWGPRRPSLRGAPLARTTSFLAGASPAQPHCGRGHLRALWLGWGPRCFSWCVGSFHKSGEICPRSPSLSPRLHGSQGQSPQALSTRG